MINFKCWHGDLTEDDGFIVGDLTSQWAAEEYVKQYEEGAAEFPVASGRESKIVHVRDMRTGELSKWEVIGETVPQYRSERR